MENLQETGTVVEDTSVLPRVTRLRSLDNENHLPLQIKVPSLIGEAVRLQMLPPTHESHGGTTLAQHY